AVTSLQPALTLGVFEVRAVTSAVTKRYWGRYISGDFSCRAPARAYNRLERNNAMSNVAGPKKAGDETGRSLGKARPTGLLPQAIVAAAALGATAWVLSQSLFAQSVPQPVLRIAPSGTNQVLVTITNGVSTANYELYYTLGL